MSACATSPRFAPDEWIWYPGRIEVRNHTLGL